MFKFIKNFITVKKLQKEKSRIEQSLKDFSHVQIKEETLKILQSLKGLKKEQNLITAFEDLKNEVDNHNATISELKTKFDLIIENDKIDQIIEHIDGYDIEKINQINQIVLSVGKFSIPANCAQKEQYLTYIKDFGVLYDNYDKIVRKHSLINDFNAIITSLGEDYIDEKNAETVLQKARKIIDDIKGLNIGYYQIPKLDEKIIDRHNEEYILKHLNEPIFDDVNGKSLDDDQRRACLCDSYANLTVAGAGAGKTLTICGKVKWLLSTNKATENEILLLSYSKNSATDLEQKISKINKNIKVKTFHGLGYEILNLYNGSKRAVEDQFLNYIKDFFDEELPKRPALARQIFDYFTFYLYPFDEEDYKTEGEKLADLKSKDFVTLKDRLQKSTTDENKRTTFQKEYVKSNEELSIANYLFVNGIEYEYESPYKIKTATLEKRQYTPDFYLPKYDIYIEHYGINENGRTPQYSKEEEIEYLNGIEWKRNIHEENNTTCIETYSYEFKNNQIFTNLESKLKEHGVQFSPLDEKQIVDSLYSIYEGQDLSSFFNLVTTFLNLYKSQYPDEGGFEELLKKAPDFYTYDYARAKNFFDICKEIYNYYIQILREKDKIDFDDMILQSKNALQHLNGYRYKYVIVDEFQDISKSRADFLKAIIKHGNAKLFAVGDDWQAIYRFAGCDIDLFVNFGKYFGKPKQNFITTTHRNSQELQDVVEPFITANSEQLKKHIKSAKSQKDPIRLIYHDNNKSGAFYKALKNIEKTNKSANVLVLGRNRADIKPILESGLFSVVNNTLCSKDFPQMKITYKTVHSSKGLESDYVILISGDGGKNGFPNRIEDDPLINYVLCGKSSFSFAEERRLFYVALTRTRSIVYILSNNNNPSCFVQEIEKNIKVENPSLIKLKKDKDLACPHCKSGTLILRETKDKKSKFYSCSNYPYCNYTINDISAVVRNNRCPACGDFLVERNGKYGKFMGCHGYPYCKYTNDEKNKKSANRTVIKGFYE